MPAKLDSALFLPADARPDPTASPVIRLWSLNPENGRESECLFVLEKPVKEGPYRYDWGENEWTEGPAKPSLAPPLREELMLFAQEIRLQLACPFVCRLVRWQNKFYLEQLEPMEAPEAACFDSLWEAIRGCGLRTGSPFKTSLYAAARRRSLKAFYLESTLLKEKEIKEEITAVLYGRAYENLGFSLRILSRLPGFSEKAFAEYYGLKTDRLPVKKRFFPLMKWPYQMKFKLAAKLALPAGGRGRSENDAERFEHMAALYEQSLTADMHPQKLAVMWYQLTHGEFYEAEGALARSELSAAGAYLQFRRGHKDGASALPRLGGHPELEQFRKLWTLSRALRAGSQESPEDALARFFPDSAADRRLRRKLQRDLDFLLTVEDKYAPAFLQPETGKLPQQKPGASLTGPESRSAAALREALCQREAYAAWSRRFYRLVLRYSEKMGELLVKEGILTQPQDWRLLKFEEISGYAAERVDAVSMREYRSGNSRYYFSYRRHRSPHILGCPPAPSDFTGLAASPGRYRGRLCVCLGFRDLNKFRPGDILLCRQSDIAWDSRLLLAGGAAALEGGLFSHTALLTREAGIPCLTALRAAPEDLQDGAWAELDAESGRLSILSAAPGEPDAAAEPDKPDVPERQNEED